MAKNIERIEKVRELATEGWSAAEIAYRLGCTRNAIIGVSAREKIVLGGGNRLRPRANTQEKSTALKPAANTHFVVEKPTERPRGTVTCMWVGCAEPPIKSGKPYCSKHRRQSGGLL